MKYAWIAALVLAMAAPAKADLVIRLPTEDKVVALTFDACEQQHPMKLDTKITDWLVAHKIPFTVFLSGRFVESNAEAIRKLAAQPFIEFENHSWNHPMHMKRLSDEAFRDELTRTDDEVFKITGRRTAFFRFPAFNYDARTLKLAEDMGYTVVHARWASGDPDKHETAASLISETMWRTRPGDILIHHVNGRGWHSAEAMPALVEGLIKKGYRFVLLRDYLKPRR